MVSPLAHAHTHTPHITVIVTKAFSALMWEFSRSWPLIRQSFIHWCVHPTSYTHTSPTIPDRTATPPTNRFVDYDRITNRQRRTSLLYKPAMYYGWTYPSLLLVLTICLTYDVIMPVTLLLGVVYFFLVEILYTCVDDDACMHIPACLPQPSHPPVP